MSVDAYPIPRKVRFHVCVNGNCSQFGKEGGFFVVR
jgi:hypothetical protein